MDVDIFFHLQVRNSLGKGSAKYTGVITGQHWRPGKQHLEDSKGQAEEKELKISSRGIVMIGCLYDGNIT